MNRGTSLTAIALVLASCSGGGGSPSSGGGPGTVVVPTPTPSPTPTPTPTPAAEDPNPLPVAVGPVLTLNNNLVMVGESLAINFGSELQAQIANNVVNRAFPSYSYTALADYQTYPDKARTLIIWSGHNNYRDPDRVVSDIAAMVAAAGHQRYIVIGLVYEDIPDERIGGASRAAKIEVNTRLATAYGDRFINAQSLLNAAANPNNSQDRADLVIGVTPSTLRIPGDLIHLRRASGERVLMNAIRAVMVARGY